MSVIWTTPPPIKLSGIPMVPSLNNAYPTGRHGRRFKSAEYRTFEREFEMWAFLNSASISAAAHALAERQDLRLSVICTYFFREERILCRNGNNKKLDIDNRAKPLLDAVTKAIGFDDSAIWGLILLKRVGLKDCCDVEIMQTSGVQ